MISVRVMILSTRHVDGMNMENVNSARYLDYSCPCGDQEFRSKDYSQPDNFVNLNTKGYSSSPLLSKSNKECERIDRVSILAFYNKPLHHECVVLIKQYRPHLRTYTIEMPTGLVENNELPDVLAVRILSEQTGYIGFVKTVGPPLADSPCSTTQCSRIVSMRIDGNDLRNSPIKSTCTYDKHNRVILVKVEELLDKLKGFTECNYFVDSKIDAFAIGLVKGKSSRKEILQNF